MLKPWSLVLDLYYAGAINLLKMSVVGAYGMAMLRLRLEGGVGSTITTLDKKACEGLVWLGLDLGLGWEGAVDQL